MLETAIERQIDAMGEAAARELGSAHDLFKTAR